MRRKRLVFLVKVFLVFLASCAPAHEVKRPFNYGSGQVTVFLKGPEESPLILTIQLEGLKAQREDGSLFPVVEGPRSLNSIELLKRQVLLGEAAIPPVNIRVSCLKYPGQH